MYFVLSLKVTVTVFLKKELFDYILFAKKLDPLSSRVIGDIVDFVSHISDMAETCADQMELLKILRQA